jgi:invasion protein IalB
MRRRTIDRRFPWTRFAMSFTVGMLAATAMGAAQTQQPGDGGGKPSEVEVGPRGQHMPRDIQYSAWRKLCFKSSDGKTLCRTSSNGTWDTGQVAVRVDLIERADGEPRLQVFLPVGLYLQPGVKVAVDKHQSLRFPYSWCLTNICVAANRVGSDLIHEMETGKNLALEVVNSNISTIATSVPLDNFATAHKGPPDRTIDFQFDSD